MARQACQVRHIAALSESLHALQHQARILLCVPPAAWVVLQYPLLTGHYKRIAELPGVKEYLASPLRLEKINGNGMG